MNELMWISGVHVYTDEMGTAYLNLEDVARGLGFIETSGDYIRWQRVERYLNDLKFSTSGERPKFIPENVFSYLTELKFSQQVAMAIKSRSRHSTFVPACGDES